MKATIILSIVFAIYISEASSGWKQVLIDVEKSRETVENGRRNVNAEPQTGYSSCKEDNILYDGPDIGEKPKLYADMETCHKYCGAIPKCEVWVLYKKGKVCILKSLADRLEKKNNGEFVSGLKDCPKASTTVPAPTTVSAPVVTPALVAVSAPTTVSAPAPAAVQAPKTVSAPAAVPEPEAVPTPTSVPALLKKTSTTVSVPVASPAPAAVSAPTTVSAPVAAPAPAAIPAPKTVSTPAAVPEPEAVPAPTTVSALLKKASTTPQHEHGYAGNIVVHTYDDNDLEYYANIKYEEEFRERRRKLKKYGKCKKGKKCKKCKKGKKCRGRKKKEKKRKKKKGKRG